jgi:protein-S-isoprenylcysteine O-methyltransferase Ste14
MAHVALPGEHPKGDMGQGLLFIAFMVVWVLDSFFLKLSIMLAARVPLYVRLGWTAVFLAIGLALVLSGHKVLEIRGSTRLLTTGAFRRVRHPLYLGAMLFYLALWGATLSLAALGIMVIIAFFYNFIAAYEERKLEDKFGEAYSNYKKNVPRWIPKL